MKIQPAILICLQLLTLAANAQGVTITGTVTDSATGRPVASASVFLSSTSTGTTTDTNGAFALHRVPQGRYNLIVSCLGYATWAQQITAGQAKTAIIRLTASANNLGAVTVRTYDDDGWERWGKDFEAYFIGTSYEAGRCTIKNKDVIKFIYSPKKDIMHAYAEEPIVIENKQLGYIIHYKLEGFVYDVGNHSFSYTGYPLFEEMAGDARTQKRWAQNRHDAYYGSIMHFMRCLYVNKLLENGFEIHRLEKIPSTEKKRILALYQNNAGPQRSQYQFENSLPPDTLQYYKTVLSHSDSTQVQHKELVPADSVAYAVDSVTAVLSFNNYLYVVYKGRKEEWQYWHHSFGFYGTNKTPPHRGDQTSEINMVNNTPVYVLYNGAYYQPADLLTLGYWGWAGRVCNMLPFDYWP